MSYRLEYEKFDVHRVFYLSKKRYTPMNYIGPDMSRTTTPKPVPCDDDCPKN